MSSAAWERIAYLFLGSTFTCDGIYLAGAGDRALTVWAVVLSLLALGSIVMSRAALHRGG